MVVEARKTYRLWLFYVGLIVVLITCVGMAIGLSQAPLTWVVGAGAVGIVLGCGLMLLRRIQASVYDPNDMASDLRHDIATKRAYTADRIAELQQAIDEHVNEQRSEQLENDHFFLRLSFYFFIGVGLVLIALGSYFAKDVVPTFLKAQRSESWPHVEGIVRRSEVAQDGRMEKGRLTIIYSPAVEYTYTINGRDFVGNVLELSPPAQTQSRSAAAGAIAGISAGRSVQVFYDPENPTDCVLRPGPKGWHYVLLALCGGLIVAGIVVLVAILRQRPATSPTPATNEK